MATTTQTATQASTPPVSPSKRAFPYISPRKAVASMISPKRHSSIPDLARSNGTRQQNRVVSTPLQNGGDARGGNVGAAAGDLEATPSVASARSTLSFSHVADIFVKLRRVQNRVKAHHIVSSSGTEPITHPSLTPIPITITEPPAPPVAGPSNAPPPPLPAPSGGDVATEMPKKRARLELTDEYVCSDAVDVPKLLRASRTTLLDRASLFHANVLTEEVWSCSICAPKYRNDGTYRVHVRYAATAARSTRRDPRQPVALKEVQSIPGLMTIVSREIITITVELYQDPSSQ